MTGYPLDNQNSDERLRKRRRKKSINLKAFYGSLETYTEKFLEEGRTEEEIKEMACNKIEETSRKMGERKVDPEVQKAIHNLIDKGIDREDIDDEILEDRLQSIMEKFRK